jgi:hypothetical protein
MKHLILAGGTLLGLAAPTPAAAQATVAWDAAVFSSYVWRGVTFTNRPVLQPDLSLAVPLGRASLTAGGWANVDIGRYDGSTDLAESGGASALNLAELDLWGELSVPAGRATLAGGAIRYIFPNPAGSCSTPCYTELGNTVELYGKVALSAPLSPKVTAYYDIDKVKGVYVEGSVSQGVRLGATTLNLGALVGWNHGEGPNPSDKAYNFADNGFTHVDLSASLPFSAGAVTIAPAVHGVVGIDDNTRFQSPFSGSPSTDFKVWGGVALSWSGKVGGKGVRSEE